MEKSLKFFEPGESGIVKHVVGEGPIKRRLFDMGVTPGVEIVMKKLAPLGDPMEISLRGYELTLRKTEAEHIVMYVEDLHYRGEGRNRRGRRTQPVSEIKEQPIIASKSGEKVINEDLYCRVGRRGQHKGHRFGRGRNKS
ncbi:MAG: ferrous iron transport protein A [Clostridiales bacterium]|jgi:ferrous iron transport protein A|nr:ferrous iron transport protein A [Clostridiales bacterium]